MADCDTLARVPAVDGVCSVSFHYHYQQQMPKEVSVKGNKKYLEDMNNDALALGVSIPELRQGLKEKALTVRWHVGPADRGLRYGQHSVVKCAYCDWLVG